MPSLAKTTYRAQRVPPQERDRGIFSSHARTKKDAELRKKYPNLSESELDKYRMQDTLKGYDKRQKMVESLEREKAKKGQ